MGVVVVSCLFLIVDLLIHSGDIGNQTLKLSKIACTVDFGWVNICICNFFISAQKFTKSSLFNAAGIDFNEVCFLYISENAIFMPRHVAKFHRVTPLNFKVIGANMLHFKPIFDPSLKKIVGVTISPVGYGLARLGHCAARVKILGHSTP